MMYLFVLVLHISIACLTGGIIAYTSFALWKRMDASYRACALVLGYIAALEVLTGTALAFLSPALSAGALSLHIFEYLGACLFVEALIFARMQKGSLPFPAGLAASPVLLSIVAFVAAIHSGM
jgi:hypothetical protein